MKRTDIHRPSAINPADYQFIAFEYVKVEDLGSAEFLREQRDIIREHQANTGASYSDHEHGGNCMVCGNANAVYTVLFYHRDTNTYIRTGQDCAEKMNLGFDKEEFNAFHAAVRDALELRAGKRKAKATLEEAGALAAWDIYESKPKGCHCAWSQPDVNGVLKYNTGFIYPEQPCTCEVESKESWTVRDMVGKLVKYGSISDKAMDYLRKLVTEIIPRSAEITAQRAAEKAAAADCPAGRIVVNGIVLKAEWKSNKFGCSPKATIKTDAGYLVYSSLPGSLVTDDMQQFGIITAMRGKQVAFKATVTPSTDDPKFGYGSRPTAV